MTLFDHALPPEAGPATLDPPEFRPRATELERLTAALAARGASVLAEIGRPRLLAVWSETVEAFLDPASPERRALDGPLAERCRLSPAGLRAGLTAVLGGVRREPAARLFEEAEATASAAAVSPARDQPALIILASNLPALAVQPLLPALAAGRAVIVKSPSAEPLFAPAFVRALGAREPRLRQALVALTWQGGDRELEAPLLAACDPVIAYGESETLASLAHRATGRLVGYGPKTSLAVISKAADPGAAASGLARDVALFDQRGCLSVAAIYTDGSAEALAEALAEGLAAEAYRLPPGPSTAPELAGVQQVRAEAEMRGLALHRLTPAAGTVVVEPDPAFRPSPGLRTVRVHSLLDLAELPGILTPWQDRLQGAALAGEDAWALRGALEQLGVSRCAMLGCLQSPDATWHNGGVSPLSEFLR